MNTVLAQRPARLTFDACVPCRWVSIEARYTPTKSALPTMSAPRRSRKQSLQPRALSAQERAAVSHDCCTVKAYCDQPPAEVYQRLLEQDQYLCSVSTMHRHSSRLGRERRSAPAAAGPTPCCSQIVSQRPARCLDVGHYQIAAGAPGHLFVAVCRA